MNKIIAQNFHVSKYLIANTLTYMRQSLSIHYLTITTNEVSGSCSV